MQLWDNKGADSLYLFTPEELKKLPDGIVLESIMGDFKTKGKDYIDDDVRFGHTAYGVRNPWNHAEKHPFLLFVLAR